jgi:hypothetical protein
MPGTGGAFTASTDAVLALSSGTAQVVKPLTSIPSSRGQRSATFPRIVASQLYILGSGSVCGELPTPLEMAKPVGVL